MNDFQRFAVRVTAIVLPLLLVGASANAEQFAASFSGFQEIGALNAATGAILTSGEGSLLLQSDAKSNSIAYTLTYSGLSSNVTQAHIHFGQRHVAGGIVVFLCTNLGNGPAGTPACPPTGGTVTGSIDPASVLAVPGQNVPAGDLAALEAILEGDSAYGNIHTVRFPAGEIRGQIHKGGSTKTDQ